MPLNISSSDVKRKCMLSISEADHDTQIDSLITEMRPGIEYTIADTYLNNTSDGALQATLTLGVLEIISGEFLEQLSREAGAAEMFSFAGLSIGERKEKGQLLKAQGQARLSPFLKANQPLMPESQRIIYSCPDSERKFSLDESVW